MAPVVPNGVGHPVTEETPGAESVGGVLHQENIVRIPRDCVSTTRFGGVARPFHTLP